MFAIAKRCVNAKNLPPEAEFTKILDLPIAEAKALKITEFLSRMKIGAKFDHACKVKADREKHDKKYQGEPIEAVIKAVKEEFGRLARSYLVYLLSETQGLKGLTTNIIRGLCAFDLNTLLVEPLELGKYCIGQLFSSFRLRDYYSPTEESQCLDEYITFVDDLRQRYTSMSQPTFFIFDTIDFLSGQETLQSRPLLYKLFRLSCLCIDVPFAELPMIKFWGFNSDDPTCQLIDLIQPVQSYFTNVARGEEVMTREESVTKFLALEPTFGSTALSDVYCPWLSVDFFGRAKIFEGLDPTKSCPRAAQSSSKTQRVESIEPPTTIYFPRGKKRTRKSVSSRDRSSSGETLHACTSASKS